MLGDAHYQLGELDIADELLQRCIYLNDEYPTAWAQVGHVFAAKLETTHDEDSVSSSDVYQAYMRHVEETKKQGSGERATDGQSALKEVLWTCLNLPLQPLSS